MRQSADFRSRQVPLVRWRPFLGQAPWVSVNPQVNIEKPSITAPINIELGSLPLSIGFFAASGLAFLLRTALPDGWPQSIALIGGGGLAVAGVVNLVLPKAQAAAAAPAAPGAPQAPGIPAAPALGSSPWCPTPAEEDAFQRVIGRIVSPANFSTLNISPVASSYPVRVQVQNKSSGPVTFEMELVGEEDPHPFGAEVVSSLPVQVSLGPNQIRDIDVSMPLSSWGALVDYADVRLTANKRRSPGEAAVMLDYKSFVLE
jgi:hypothetical protein